MSDQLARLTGEWSTSVLPTQTTLTHINPTNIYGVVETLMSLSSAYPTVTKNLDLYQMARAAKGAKASLLVISAQNYIATATDTQQLPLMTQIIWNATMELQDLEMGYNLYQMKLSFLANLIFVVVFACVFLFHIGIGVWRKHVYFSVCLSLGSALEIAGYAARILSIGNYSDKLTFLTQIISLTLAPAFVMAGVYFLLAQLLVIYGHQYSILRPLWFSYIFIICDVSSLAIQAGGGGLTAIKLQNLEPLGTGTNIMIAGIAIQVFSMSLFLYFFFDFVFRMYFRASPEVKFLVRNTFALLFQTSRGRQLSLDYLHANYNEKYNHIWTRKRFGYYPFVLFLSVFFVYIRCVYRLVELSEGWTGYLITHEEYVMTLDGLMVLITCIILVPFHPGIMMGENSNISMKEIKALDKEKDGFPENKDGDKFHNEDSHQSPTSQNDNAYRTLMDTYSGDSFLEKDDARYFEHVAMSSSADTLTTSSPQIFATPTYNYESRLFSPSPSVINGPIEDGGILSVPYENTISTPRVNSTDLPTSLPRSVSKKKKIMRDRQHSLAVSINPYERPITEERLSTYGPYEEYSGRPREVNPFEDDNDVQSQISNDEFLFTMIK